MSRSASFTVHAQIGDHDGSVVVVLGREAWALRMRVAPGEHRCTPIDHPGPRWSGYVHDLRAMGFVIETIHETHGGPFPETHARYVLRTPVRVLSQSDERDVA